MTFSWHFAPLFNANNFNNVDTNIFGDITSINLLCVPKEDNHSIVGFPKIEGPDDSWKTSSSGPATPRESPQHANALRQPARNSLLASRRGAKARQRNRPASWQPKSALAPTDRVVISRCR